MRTYIIAEAGVNHNGDINLAKRLIDIAKESGADAVKFQTFKAEETTSVNADKAEYQKANTGGESQLEMIKKLELPFSDFAILKEYSKEKGIDFISTPDGIESLNCLIDLNLSLIKVGSTEVTNYKFLNALARTNKPLILSTGMSTLAEVEKAINVLKEAGCAELTLMHCTTSYPTDVKDVNIRAMVTMRDAFKLDVGYSDHTCGIEAAVSAVALGATCIEKHITIDKTLPGPDHQASANPEEFKEYVKAIRNTEMLLGNGIKAPSKSEESIMKNIRRSIIATKDIKKGMIITEEMIDFKRPGDGIYPEYAEIIIGMRVNRDIRKEEKILWTDIKE